MGEAASVSPSMLPRRDSTLMVIQRLPSREEMLPRRSSILCSSGLERMLLRITFSVLKCLRGLLTLLVLLSRPSLAGQLTCRKSFSLRPTPRPRICREIIILTRRREDNPADVSAKDMAVMMFNTATLRSGYPLKDTVNFAEHIETMMRKTLGVDVDEAIEEEEEITDEEPPEDDEEEAEDDAPVDEQPKDEL